MLTAAEGRRAPVAAALAFAVVAVSTAAIGVREAAPLDAGWIAAGRVGVTALVTGLVFAGSVRVLVQSMRADPRLAMRVVLAGCLLAGHFATWIASLTLTTVVKSVALVTTQPLFAALLGRVLGDPVPRRIWVGSLVAFGGASIMTGLGGAPLGGDDWLGVGLALAGAAFAAGYLAVGRSVRERVAMWGYFAGVNLVAGVTLVLLAAATVGSAGLDPAGIDPMHSWAWVVYLGIVPGIVGHGMLNWSVRRVPLHVVSLVAILETAGAGVLAWLWLDEAPGGAEVLGALVLSAGVAYGVSTPKGRPSPESS